MFKFFEKFFYVFPSRKYILIPWFGLFVLVSFLEVGGIVFIAPFIALATEPEKIQSYTLSSWIYQALEFPSSQNFLIAFGIFIVVVFLFKSGVAWYIQALIFKLSYLQRQKLIQRLMSGYFNVPYTFHLQRNTSQVLNNVISQTDVFANSILKNILNIAVGSITVFFISLYLFYLNRYALLSIVLIVLPLILIFKKTSQKMKFWGKELYLSNQEIIRNINHGLGSIKENLVIGCEDYFEQETSEQVTRLANASIYFYGLKSIPKYLIESVLVLAVVVFVCVTLYLGKDVGQLTSVLGAFGIAAIRLVPAFSGLSNSFSTLKNASFTLDQLFLELTELDQAKQAIAQNQQHLTVTPDPSPGPLMFEDVIRLDRLSYQYPQGETKVVENLSFELKKGESIALIGKSGAGKTTIVDLILGLLIPQEGDITVDGVSIYQGLRQWQDLIGYIPQVIFLLDDSLVKNIAFGVPDAEIDSDRVEAAVKAAQLDTVVAQLPQGLETRVGERGVMLSGGQRQRVGIARALYHSREILVLDEATSALDNETEALVTESIQALSKTKTMILIAHRLSTVKHCDRIYVIENGQVVKSGSYEETVGTMDSEKAS